jgi:nitrogen fixation NifU-like protein
VDALYQQLILKHNASPHGYGRLELPSHRIVGANPLCGDQLEIEATLADHIEAIAFTADASALTVATASMLMAELPGKTLVWSVAWLSRLLDAFTLGAAFPEHAEPLRPLAALIGQPNRLKAVTLPIVACLALLEGQAQASTDTHPRGEQLA